MYIWHVHENIYLYIWLAQENIYAYGIHMSVYICKITSLFVYTMLALVNDTAMNIAIYISFIISVFLFFG